MLRRPLDVNVGSGEGGRMSDNSLVEARLIVVCGWRSAGRMAGVRNVLKVSEQNKIVKKRAHLVSLREKYEVLRCAFVESVETESEMSRDIV